MHAGDRAAHALGVRDDGFALGDEFVDERADADLIVGIGALKRRDLAADERLEFAGAGKRTLHAVTDGGDSRRTACETERTASVEKFSGWARRMATSPMARATIFISCERTVSIAAM